MCVADLCSNLSQVALPDARAEAVLGTTGTERSVHWWYQFLLLVAACCQLFSGI